MRERRTIKRRFIEEHGLVDPIILSVYQSDEGEDEDLVLVDYDGSATWKAHWNKIRRKDG